MSGFFLSPRIAWGTGALEQLSGLGVRRAVLLVDPAVARHDGARRLVEELAKCDASVEVETASERANSLDEVDRVAERSREHPPDALLALGGGRTIDAAKAVRLRWAQPDLSLAELPPTWDPPTTSGILLIAVPTTSGSGAEASWAADLRTADGAPFEIAHRSLIPDWALVDPALAASLAPAELMDGAFEALALATEAFLSAWANPFSDALALDATTAIVRRLPHAIRWSDDPDARAALHYAATAAGLAASNAQRGLAHALARALEGPTGLPYARLLGLALPYVLDFDHPSARDRLETLAERARDRDERSDASLAQRLRRLYGQLPFPLTVRAAGGDLTRAESERAFVLARALRSPGALANPRVPTDADLATLVTAILG
ncbi:MAG TPA: iron-containing alcohol dehydrogenase [Thermoplasmata archaeon]|nr:iron-containing alcohol dehydrogenase [Thermoplasmata archaeon]